MVQINSICILEKLKLMNKTAISEDDIGLAVIYSSTDKHCNPNHHHSLINLETQPSVTESQASVILANETEVLQQFNIIVLLILFTSKIMRIIFILGLNCGG